MRTICRKIVAKLDNFATVSRMGVAYFALEISWALLTFFQLFLAYLVLKALENLKKKHNFFRVEGKLAVLP